MPNWLPADEIAAEFEKEAYKCKSIVELDHALGEANSKNRNLWRESWDSKDISTSVNASRIGSVTADNLRAVYAVRWRALKLEEERAVPLPVRGG